MDKKILFLFGVLVVVMLIVSACEENIGGEAGRNVKGEQLEKGLENIEENLPMQFNSQNLLDEIQTLRNNEEKLNIKEINKVIKEKGGLWKAGETKFSNITKEEAKEFLGLKITDQELQDAKTKQEQKKSASPKGRDDLPDFFDWRDLHGGLDYTTPIRDQSSCGSCWAFGAVGALEAGIDAYYNNPNLNVDLSEQDLVSCYLPYGCCGGSISEIETLFGNYFQNTGIANETCFLYEACDATNPPPCYLNDCSYEVPCSNKCANWQDGAWKTLSYTESELTIDALKTTLIENGPIEVGMEVYQDFFSYENGIYHHVIGNSVGYHAVLVVGFGVYDGMDYWIVKNSWNNWWGEDGYFRILVGDCLIDSWFAYAVEQPEPLLGNAPEKLCTDNDNDNYCYWGLSNKPSNCPTCDNLIEDCDDSNATIFENCGQNTESTGFFNVDSDPPDAKVYVKDFYSEDWFYRGKTPIQFELNVGERKVKIKKIGYFEANITANITENSNEEINIILEHDPQFLEGWPVEIISAYPNEERVVQSFLVTDLNNDGTKEVIIITTTHDENNPFYSDSIYVIESNGEFMDGWPKSLPEEGYVREGSIAADLNNDGNKEIIVLARTGYNSNYWPKGYIQIYNYDGTTFDGWPKIINPINQVVGLTVGDIDLNGDIEIIAGSGSTYGTGIDCLSNLDCGPTGICYNGYCMDVYRDMYVFNSNGTNFEGWPIEFDMPYVPRSPPVLTNLDDDPELEIVITAFNQLTTSTNPLSHYTYAFNSDGSLVTGFPSIIPNNSWGWTLVSGDINNDNINEIITQKGPISNQGEYLNWNNPNIKMYSVSLGNVNQDSNIEIVYGDVDGKAYLVDYEGNQLTGWPIGPPQNNFYADGVPIIGDLFGNKEKEIIIPWLSYNGGKSGLYVYNLNGTIIEGFPKFQGEVSADVYVVEDLDNDGDIEMISSSTNGQTIIVLDLIKEYNSSSLEWPMFQHDAQHTGNYHFGSNQSLECSDGTSFNECSFDKPLYCSVNGDLVDNCQECGCSGGFVCVDDGQCYNASLFDCEDVTDFSICAAYGMCDANLDGTINGDDVTHIAQYSINLLNTCGFQGAECYCDISGDGTISGTDASRLSRMLPDDTAKNLSKETIAVNTTSKENINNETILNDTNLIAEEIDLEETNDENIEEIKQEDLILEETDVNEEIIKENIVPTLQKETGNETILNGTRPAHKKDSIKTTSKNIAGSAYQQGVSDNFFTRVFNAIINIFS